MIRKKVAFSSGSVCGTGPAYWTTASLRMSQSESLIGSGATVSRYSGTTVWLVISITYRTGSALSASVPFPSPLTPPSIEMAFDPFINKSQPFTQAQLEAQLRALQEQYLSHQRIVATGAGDTNVT